MKKILLPILTLGGLLFAASCQMDEPDAGTLTGEVDFSITAGIPSGISTYADPAGSGSHNGGAVLLDPDEYTLRYTLEVYDKDRKLAYDETKNATTGTFDGVTFDVRLLAKVYDFVFWADFVKNDGEVAFYNVDDLTNITYAGTTVNAQALATDAADAYYKKEEVDLTQSNQALDVTLKRPFGKIRLIATDVLDGNKQTEIPKSVTIDFGNASIPTAFNAFEGKVREGITADAGVVNFLANKETTMVNNQEKKDVYLLGINYIFESSAIPSYSMDVTVTSDQDNIIGQRSLSSIPVQENKLTTVIGNFYTNEGSIDVVVEDSFDEPEIEMTEMEMLKNIASNGGEITLNDDCIFSEEPFIVDPGEGKSVVINLNGHTIESINPNNPNNPNDAIWVKSGTLIINGDGNVGGENGYYAVWATGDSKVILNGGNYYGNGACIQAKENAQVKINGGYYKVGQPYNGVYFVINLQDNQPNTILVTGGQFENCDPSNTGTEPADVNDNFLADGYSSVKISDNPDVYEVVKAHMVETSEDLLSVITDIAANGGAITFANDIEVSGDIILPSNVSLNLNGNKLTAQSIQAANDNSVIAITNGTVELSGTENRVELIAGNSTLTLDGVKLNASSLSGPAICSGSNDHPEWADNKIVIRNSTIEAGHVGIQLENAHNLTIENSTINHGYFGINQNGVNPGSL